MLREYNREKTEKPEATKITNHHIIKMKRIREFDRKDVLCIKSYIWDVYRKYGSTCGKL